MDLLKALCPKCNGQLELDPNDKMWFCTHCKSEVNVSEAIAKFQNDSHVYYSPDGRVDNVPTTQNSMIIRAKQMLADNDIDSAYSVVQNILLDDPYNHEAWSIEFNIETLACEIWLQGAKRRGEIYFDEYAYRLSQCLPAGYRMIEYAPENLKDKYNTQVNCLESKIYSIEHRHDKLLANTGKEQPKAKQQKNDFCYIATAIYGDYDAPNVVILRKFRDKILDKNIFGRCFIKLYYDISPPFAKYLKKAKKLNLLVRKILNIFVKKLKEKYKW
jgi:hypothetical protein